MSGVVVGFSIGSFDGIGTESGSFAGIGAGAWGSNVGACAGVSESPSVTTAGAAGINAAKKSWNSLSDSIVLLRASILTTFFGTLWNGAYSI